MGQPECVDFQIRPDGILLEMIVVPAGSCRRFASEGDAAPELLQSPLIEVPEPFLLNRHECDECHWFPASRLPADAHWGVRWTARCLGLA